MTTLKISDDNAKKIFSEGNPVIKDILIDSFGEDFFKVTKYKKYQDIKSFEDACEVSGEDHLDKKFYEGTPDDIAYKKIKVIVLALNKIADPTSSAIRPIPTKRNGLPGSNLITPVSGSAFRIAMARLRARAAALGSAFAQKKFQTIAANNSFSFSINF